MLKIRPLQHDDKADVLRLNDAAAPAVFRLNVSALSGLMAISDLHLVAVSADGIVAAYALVFSKEQPYDGEEFLAFREAIAEPFLYVDQIAVDESARGSGIGKMLCQALASQGHGLGTAALCCEVNIVPPNPVSLAFHHSMGFIRIGEMATQDGRTVALLMRELL